MAIMVATVRAVDAPADMKIWATMKQLRSKNWGRVRQVWSWAWSPSLAPARRVVVQ